MKTIKVKSYISQILRYVTTNLSCWNEKCSQMITKISKSHPLGTVNVCTSFHGNPSNICWEMSVWTKAALRKSSSYSPYDYTLYVYICFVKQLYNQTKQNDLTYYSQLKRFSLHSTWVTVTGWHSEGPCHCLLFQDRWQQKSLMQKLLLCVMSFLQSHISTKWNKCSFISGTTQMYCGKSGKRGWEHFLLTPPQLQHINAIISVQHNSCQCLSSHAHAHTNTCVCVCVCA